MRPNAIQTSIQRQPSSFTEQKHGKRAGRGISKKGLFLLLLLIPCLLWSGYLPAQEEEEEIGELSEGLRAFTKKGKMGFMDASGRIVLQPRFDIDRSTPPAFKNGKCLFYRKTVDAEGSEIYLCGLIDRSFNVVLPADYEDLGEVSEGLRAFKKSGKMGFMDSAGKTIRPPVFEIPKFQQLPRFKEGLCLFYVKKTVKTEHYDSESYRCGFIDRNFKVAIPADYPNATMYCDDYNPVFEKDRTVMILKEVGSNQDQVDRELYTIIDKTGKRIGQPFEYNMGCTAACVFFPKISEGYCAVYQDKGYSYLDAETGKMAIDGNYTRAGPFSEGIAAVELDNRRLILIDKSGRQVTDKSFRTRYKDNEVSYFWVNTCLLPGFVDGRMLIAYYENNREDSKVYALIDRNGTVLQKIPAESYRDQFEKYSWPGR